MGTKTISISDEAYGILKTRKKDKESFSEVIVRLSGKDALSSFYGILTRETGEALEKNIAHARKQHKEVHSKRHI